MTIYFILLTLLLFYQIVEELACLFGSSKDIDELNHNSIWEQFNKANRNKKKKNDEFWGVPDNLKNEYGKWIKDYLDKLNETMMNEKLHGKPKLPEGMSIPAGWKGYGAGSDGHDPPPWAIVPDSYDKPDYCFLDSDKGGCPYRVPRWGFNSYYGDCFKFNYSGCGGNGNNFSTKRRCLEACGQGTETNCKKVSNFSEYGEELACLGSGTKDDEKDKDGKSPSGTTTTDMPAPKAWKAYGPGVGGVDPPKDALLIAAYGKPDFCLLKADPGFCSTTSRYDRLPRYLITGRWAYDARANQCKNFTYSGCAGNDNNFTLKSRCEYSCMKESQSNCQKYGEYIEY